MQPVRSRALGAFSDGALLQEVARRAWPSIRHPGGLGWTLATSTVADDVELFFDGERVVGWAGADRSGRVHAQLDPGHGRHAHLLVDWCLRAVDADVVEVDLGDRDHDLIAAFSQVGFHPRDNADPIVGMFHPTRPPVRPPPPPAGYVVRSTRPDEVAARVEAHRAAWLPSALPWHPDHRPSTPPGASSSYDLDRHDRVTRTALYDIDLDLVVEAADGSLVGCCIVWFDPQLAVAEIEPLGVHPAHRRKGLAQALCQESVARVAQRGGREVFINAGPRPAYPASAAAYLKAGFAVRRRGRNYRLRSTIAAGGATIGPCAAPSW